MQVHKYTHSIPFIPKAVATIGTFDGVHRGHVHVLKILLEETKKIAGSSVVITFEPHPRNFLFPNEAQVPLLTSSKEKEELLASLGIDHLIVLPFDKEFSEMSASDFLEKYLIDKIGIKKIIVGYDHRFGAEKKGDVNFLIDNAMNRYEVVQVDAKIIDDITISSTKIRNALQKDFNQDIEKYLGRLYALDGRVVQGNKMGRQLGTPTANILLSEAQKLLPSLGVYLVQIDRASFEMKDPQFGICNIGKRPTIGGADIHLEVHLFDFDQDIYKEWMQFSLLLKLRDEKKFDSLEDLKSQIEKDKTSALEILMERVK